MEDNDTAYGLLAELSSLRDTDTFTDFEIVCGTRTWRVHRAVLAMHSKVLLRVCDGGFKEASERKLDLSAHNEADIERLITFMYKLNYSYGPDASNLVEEVRTDLAMYIIADQYDVRTLRKHTLEAIQCDIEDWDLALVSERADTVAEIVKMAYEHIAHAICCELVERIIDLGIHINPGKAPQLLELVHTCPEYGIDLIRFLGDRHSSSPNKPYNVQCRCPTCLAEFTISMGPQEVTAMGGTMMYRCTGCGVYKTAMAWRREKIAR